MGGLSWISIETFPPLLALLALLQQDTCWIDILKIMKNSILFITFIANCRRKFCRKTLNKHWHNECSYKSSHRKLCGLFSSGFGSSRFVYCIGEIEVGTNRNYSLKLFQLSELGGWNVAGCVSLSEMSDNLATTLPTAVNQDIVAVLELLGVLLGVLLLGG